MIFGVEMNWRRGKKSIQRNGRHFGSAFSSGFLQGPRRKAFGVDMLQGSLQESSLHVAVGDTARKTRFRPASAKGISGKARIEDAKRWLLRCFGQSAVCSVDLEQSGSWQLFRDQPYKRACFQCPVRLLRACRLTDHVVLSRFANPNVGNNVNLSLFAP
jgi:hypothetical protein